MKKLYFLITLICATNGNIFAMDENNESHQENHQTVRPVVRNPQYISALHPAIHTAFVNKIKKHLKRTRKALNTDTKDTAFNITVNHNTAFVYFSHWLKFFDATPEIKAQDFAPQLRTLFVEFKKSYDHEKIAKIENYPINDDQVFALNLKIQQMIDSTSNQVIV